ncbi:MAG: 2-amino-4-hydroxy-6-hydroxymethyldihydropteridine diphosphokinase [Propionibacteriaceae bacterium]|nr:2-amino-4-hydroxy-6-hydroxymethyldihydropteridine diphosphokinase [Propionibacteriaceae bacterium]
MIIDREVVFSIGSNLGDRLANLRTAFKKISALPLENIRASGIFETEPQEMFGQPYFLNAVVVGTSCIPAVELLCTALRIETEIGRVRHVNAIKSSRSIDIDLITVGGEIHNTDELILPHPRAHLRRFVLEPWLELAPDAVLPRLGRVDVLVQALPDQDVRRTTLELTDDQAK